MFRSRTRNNSDRDRPLKRSTNGNHNINQSFSPNKKPNGTTINREPSPTRSDSSASSSNRSSPSIEIEDSNKNSNNSGYRTTQPQSNSSSSPPSSSWTSASNFSSSQNGHQSFHLHSNNSNGFQLRRGSNQIQIVYQKKRPLLRSQKMNLATLKRAHKIKQLQQQSSNVPLESKGLGEISQLLTQEFAQSVSAETFRDEVRKANLLDQEKRQQTLLKRKNDYNKLRSQEKLYQRSKATLETPRPPEPSLPTYDYLRERQDQLDQSFGRTKLKTRKWRRQLEPGKLALVQKVFSQTGKISDLPGAYCSDHDIQKLKPHRWMNDEIATFYGVMINLRSNKFEEDQAKNPKSKRNGPKFLKAHCFTSFFINKYDSAGYDGVKRWARKVDLFKKDIIIFPVNISNAHWTCAAINLKRKRFEFYDSMGNRNESVLATLRDYIVNESLTKKNQELDVSDWPNIYNPKDLPQQNNAYDCGIFVCQFMDCLSRDWGEGVDTQFDFNQSNMNYIRTKMVYEIANREFLEEEWG